MPNYHGYSMEFEWDRAYFMPFLQAYCFYCGWIQIALGMVLIYLLFKHSPTYSKDFRNAVACYHINMFFYDFHHMYLFNPYPLFPLPFFVCHGLLCRWKAPTTLTGLIASAGSVGVTVIAFTRLKHILPYQSRLSFCQSLALLGVTAVVFLISTPGFALFAGDDPRKMAILNRPEFTWLLNKPDVLIWGDMFDTPAYDFQAYYLTFCGTYGLILFNSMLVYTMFALHREKAKIVHITRRKKDQGNKMLLIQAYNLLFSLCGSTITFIIPLMLMASTVKVGFPTSNAKVHSIIRITFMFLFLHNSMVCITIHLIMNQAYRKIITHRIKGIFNLPTLVKINHISFTSSRSDLSSEITRP